MPHILRSLLITLALLFAFQSPVEARRCGATVVEKGAVTRVKGGFDPFFVNITPASGQKAYDLAKLETIKIMAYNVENFFEHVGKFIREGAVKLVRQTKPEPKPEHDTNAIAEIINKKIMPDVAIITEIDTERGLDRFAREKLGGLYEGILIEGNDGRGIDIGLLINRALAVNVEVRTNKYQTWNDPASGGREVLLHSRDVPVFILRAKREGEPFLIVLGIHSKSKRDRAGDKQSEKWRTAQHEDIANRIIAELKQEFGENAPIIVAGDSNTDVINGKELIALRKLGFKDVLDFAPKHEFIQPEDRWNHSYHPRGGEANYKQTDTILLSPSLQGDRVRSATINYYLDENGQPKKPATFEERGKQPSDHVPMSAVLYIKDLVLRALGLD